MFYCNARIYGQDFQFHMGAFEVKDGVFGQVLPENVPADAIDLQGATVIPGLIDVHSHGNSGAYIQKCKFAGMVLDWESGVATVQQRNNFRPGDELEIISPISTGKKFTVTKIRDEDGNSLESAKLIQQTLKIPCEIPLQKGDILRLRVEE